MRHCLPLLPRAVVGEEGESMTLTSWLWDFEHLDLTVDLIEEFYVGVVTGLLLFLSFHDELYYLI